MNKRIILLLVLIGLGLSGCSLFKKKAEDPKTNQRSLINEPVNIIPVKDRPFMSLTPSNDGKKITIAANKLNKPATEAEFEFEYTAGTMIQGAFGSIDLNTGSSSYEVLLGSCSTGGTCSYHQDVQGGDLIISFKGNDTYAVKIPWRYQEIAKASDKFGSRDQKFQLTGQKLFTGNNYVIISETSGLPKELDGEILAGPYGVFASNTIKSADQATITIHLPEENASAQIKAWDGSNWQDLETTVENKSVTTDSSIYQAYVVVKP